ncbi:MAG: DJ-1 family glyoxalase III [Candidatus Omnitrophota bacterium]
MAKKALVILADGFEEIETVSCVDILRRAGIDVTMAGLKGLKVTGSRKIILLADKKLNKIKEEFDACVLPGGSTGAENLSHSKKVKSIIEKMNQEGKLIAAICASPAVVLAPLGILDNKSATCFPGDQKYFNKNTTYNNTPIVIDNNIITSQGPGTSLLFALTIVKKLCGKEISDKVKKAALIN